jgi:CheY-like chemotaxis protein
MTMPELTGDKLAEEVLRIRPDIPVIICTGFSEKLNENKAKAVGAKALLMKPFARNELAVTIRKVLDFNKKGA